MLVAGRKRSIFATRRKRKHVCTCTVEKRGVSVARAQQRSTFGQKLHGTGRVAVPGQGGLPKLQKEDSRNARRREKPWRPCRSPVHS